MMKKIVLIFITIIGITALFSCEKELRDPKLDLSQTVGAEMNEPASGTAFVLIEDEAENVMTTFAWSATVYNLSNLESPTYTLQMDAVGADFENAVTLTTTTETSYEITVGSMNAKMLANDFPAGAAQTMEFRVMSFITDQPSTETISGVITLSITPYETFVPPPTTSPSLWIPGDYQEWDPGSAPQIFSYTDDGVFKGYMFMPEGGTYMFKFTSAPDWDHTNFGLGAEEGLLDPDPGATDLSLPGPGGYQVVVDTVGLTWTYLAEEWGVIGEWLAWEDDIDLVWDAENQWLSVTLDVPEVENNRFKFRANDAWDINLGALDPDDGTLEQDGADIPIPGEGNYTFILDFKTEMPTYQFIAN